jgi:hypothetical protein
MQELHESSINKVFSMANKSAKSSLETTPSTEGLSKSLEVMVVHSD